MSRRLRLGSQGLALALVAGLLALLVWKVAHPNHVPKGTAPNFTLPRLSGSGEIELASLRGKAVVLNFAASWCVPCKQEAPLFEGLWRRYRSRGVVVLGIDAKDFRGDGRSFVRRHGITYPFVYDGPGRMYDRYGLTGFPETFFVGRTGKLVAHIPGAVGRHDLPRVEGYIRRALSS